MQNRYVGDVGDFAKYGLLRNLVAQGDFKLGVIWCLFGDESHNSDGRHTSYLGRPEFRELDPELHDRLSVIVKSDRRSVRKISTAKIFSDSTYFFDVPIAPFSPIQTTRPVREDYRIKWLSGALAATTACDLVFFDPDNGMETKSVPRYSPKSGKYIFWDELKTFWERGQSLVVYHHLNRTMTVDRQTKILKKKFAKAFPTAGFLKPVLFRRGSCRHFWIIGQAKHAKALKGSLDLMINSGWKGYFDVL